MGSTPSVIGDTVKDKIPRNTSIDDKNANEERNTPFDHTEESQSQTIIESSYVLTDSGDESDNITDLLIKQDKEATSLYDSQRESDQTEKVNNANESDFNKFVDESFVKLKSISEFLAAEDASNIKNVEDITEKAGFIADLWFTVRDKVSSRPQLQDFRENVAHFILDSPMFNFFTSVITDYPVEDKLQNVVKEKSLLCYESLRVICNYTDCSDKMTIEVSKSATLESCKKVLDTHATLQQSLLGIPFVSCCHEIVHNVSMRDTNVERLRQLGFINTLKPYLNYPSKEIQISCLASLASIVNEEECDIIKTNIRSVAHHLRILRNGLTEDERRHEGWACKEVTLAIRKLAQNDANKQMLWTLGLIPLLVKLVKIGDEDEQLEAVLTIWTLAFDKHIREYIITDEDIHNDDAELDVVDTLLKVKSSTQNKELENACERCLWILREELMTSPIQKCREAAEAIQLKASSEDSTDRAGHVMISYQRGPRDILIKIRDKLKEQNYKVWMDIDEMGGSTLQAMANAVEHSFVVLLCYSRNYKNSQYCQSEAEYAYHLNKPIIPLKMEEGYNPDGWLGIALGKKYFVEFSGKYPFEDKLKDLFKEIKSVVDKKPPRTIEDIQQMNVMKHILQIRQWNPKDVEKWLIKHGLKSHGLDSITGEEISLLAKMQIEAPDQLYRCIQKQLKLKKLLGTSRLIWALYDITKAQ